MKRSSNWLILPLGFIVGGLGCAPGEGEKPEDTNSAPVTARPTEARPTDLPPVPNGLRGRIEAALQNVQQRDLLTTHAFWTVFHGILGLGPGVMLKDPVTGRRVNAVDYICGGGRIRGLEFIPTPDGLDVRTGPQFVGQGHQDQFVAEMGQWGLPADRKFLVNGKAYTFRDFIRHTQARVRVTSDQELSWAIVVIGQYVGTDARWKNSAGEELRFEDLVRYELGQPVETAACGGTHRLFGLTWVYHLHLRRGGRPEGVWKEVARKIAEYQKRARKYQNPDGSFSTRYLARSGSDRDAQLRISTTGHVLEWLALSLPDAELRAPWMQQAASALSVMILDNQGMPVEGGALYHAAHGLRIYHDRVFGTHGPDSQSSILPLPPEPIPMPRSRPGP